MNSTRDKKKTIHFLIFLLKKYKKVLEEFN